MYLASRIHASMLQVGDPRRNIRFNPIPQGFRRCFTNAAKPKYAFRLGYGGEGPVPGSANPKVGKFFSSQSLVELIQEWDMLSDSTRTIQP